MNRDTALTQAQLNMVNQVTPYGNLTYTQNGSAFSPSDTGQTYYYNSKTGEYSQSGPKITGYTDAAQQAPRSLGNLTLLSDSTKTNAGRQPIYEDGWTQVKGNLTPQYTATTTLSPEQQAILDQTNGASLNLATIANERSDFLRDYLSKNIDLSGAPALAGGGDFSADRQRVEDALMQRQQSGLDQNREQLRTQLIATGVRPGTAAYSAQMALLGQTENDARLANILAAGQEQSRLANLQNSTRSQYMNEAYAQRNQPLAEISALMSGSQIQNPNFVNTPQTQVAGVDYTGLVSDNYKAKVASSQAAMGGLFGLGSSLIKALPWSDRRLKKDIAKIGERNGLPWYNFRYIWDNDNDPIREGLMSDDLRRLKPSAVVVDKSGYDTVDYDIALGGE